MTKGGTMLFPYDPMVEKILAMKKKRIYSMQSLAKVYDSNYAFADSLQHAKQIMEEEQRLKDSLFRIMMSAATVPQTMTDDVVDELEHQL